MFEISDSREILSIIRKGNTLKERKDRVYDYVEKRRAQTAPAGEVIFQKPQFGE